MRRIREAIRDERFDKFVKEFVYNYYSVIEGENGSAPQVNENGNKKEKIPKWVIDALASVNIKL